MPLHTRSSGIDLASALFVEPSNPAQANRALALDEKAWDGGVIIAAYELGRQYETGLPNAQGQCRSDRVKAWTWYQKGADAGEPTAIARFGEREERAAFKRAK
jgi:TPR repeat protein